MQTNRQSSFIDKKGGEKGTLARYLLLALYLFVAR